MIGIIKKGLFKAICIRNNLIYNSKISKIYYNIRKNHEHIIKNGLINKHKLMWKRFQNRINPKWLLSYSAISGIDNQYYIPENVYYNHIENTLNNYGLSEAYADKNFYESFYSNNIFPRTYLRIIDKTLFNSKYEPITSFKELKKILSEISECVIKPALDSGGGYKVHLIDKTVFNSEQISSVKNFVDLFVYKYGENVVFQEYIRQHPFFEQFNYSSLNTIRVFTYRSVKDESIKILHSVLRVGKPGSLVDNQASGGLSCGINNKGILNMFAIDKLGNLYETIGRVNLTTRPFIPWINQIHKIAEGIAWKNMHARLLGLDFCVDREERIRLIEINNRNHEINFYQMNNGPLFGKYTDEIINYCLNNKKSICIDFMI